MKAIRRPACSTGLLKSHSVKIRCSLKTVYPNHNATRGVVKTLSPVWKSNVMACVTLGYSNFVATQEGVLLGCRTQDTRETAWGLKPESWTVVLG